MKCKAAREAKGRDKKAKDTLKVRLSNDNKPTCRPIRKKRV
jgi:hypothetical protein